MRTLVVVDVQRDFYHPEGSLYVNGSEELPSAIAAVIGTYDAVIFTLDWHPVGHCSFKENGGIWPEHCVQFTEGAGLPGEIVPVQSVPTVCYHLKAFRTDYEQYGGFEQVSEQEFQIFRDSDEVHFCGIAGDYCVKETIANAMKYVPVSKIAVIPELVRSIDDGSTLEAFLTEHEIRRITL